MAKDIRIGFVMKLRKGVTRGEIRELMEVLDRVADPEWMNPTTIKLISDPENCTTEGCKHWKCRTEENPVPNREETIFQRYNAEYGDPCFYIP
jgi:hypothetical protein